MPSVIADGAFGLAPEWANTPLSESGRRWVSACVLGFVNALGVHVLVSVRGAQENLKATITADERNKFAYQEAAFYGDIFSTTPVAYVCRGRGGPLGSPVRDQRVCSDASELDGYSRCGMVIAGDCADVCAERRSDQSRIFPLPWRRSYLRRGRHRLSADGTVTACSRCLSRQCFYCVSGLRAGDIATCAAAEIRAEPLADFDEPQAPLTMQPGKPPGRHAGATRTDARRRHRLSDTGALSDRAYACVRSRRLHRSPIATTRSRTASCSMATRVSTITSRSCLIPSANAAPRYEFDVNVAGARTDGLISPAATQTNLRLERRLAHRRCSRRIEDGPSFLAIDTRGLQFRSRRRHVGHEHRALRPARDN